MTVDDVVAVGDDVTVGGLVARSCLSLVRKDDAFQRIHLKRVRWCRWPRDEARHCLRSAWLI